MILDKTIHLLPPAQVLSHTLPVQLATAQDSTHAHLSNIEIQQHPQRPPNFFHAQQIPLFEFVQSRLGGRIEIHFNESAQITAVDIFLVSVLDPLHQFVEAIHLRSI
jgi:hypothetical protein